MNETATSTPTPPHQTNVRLVHITTRPMAFRFFEGQLDYMVDAGFEIHAISSAGERLSNLDEHPGISSHTVGLTRAITPFQDLRGLAEMTRTIAAIDPDIVHSHTPKGGMIGMMAATAAGVDHRVYTMRGLPMLTMNGWKRRLLAGTEQVSCGLADRVVAVGESLRGVAVDENLVGPEKVRVLGRGSSNGVDATGQFDPNRLADGTRREVRERYDIPPEATVVGFVGRLVRDKGIEELVEAWIGLRSAYPEAVLLVCGPKGERDAIDESTFRRMQRDPSIRLAGFIEEMPAHYAAMDVVAFPSHREGFPNVPLEAAAMELPVVATDAIGCVDAVKHGATGAIVPVGEVEGLEIALSRYLASAELREEHGRAAREWVLKNYRPGMIWSELLELYEDLLGRRDAET